MRRFLQLLGFAALLTVVTAPAFAQSLNVIRDEEIEQDIRTMATPIWRAAGLSPQNVRIVLLNDNELNAFVAGGQNIFINTGLILQTKTPDELIGVIAHESGHIASGHLLRARTEMEDLSVQAMLTSLLGVAVAIGAGNGSAGLAAANAGQSVTMREFLRHSRIQESAADQSGVRFLEDSNLPVQGLLDFMRTLSSQELLPESQQTAYVRTHPLTQDRIDFLENTVANARKGASVPSAWVGLHRRVKAKLEGYLFPDRALILKGDDADTRYEKAIAYYRKSDIPKALALINPLIDEEPKNPYFHELKGQMLFEHGRIDEAASAYAKAAQYAPQSALILSDYGHTLVESKRIKDAIRVLETAVRIDPRLSAAQHQLGIAYGTDGQEGQSRLHLAEEALLQGRLDLADTNAHLAMQALPKNSPSALRAQDIADAISRARKAKKKSKNGD